VEEVGPAVVCLAVEVDPLQTIIASRKQKYIGREDMGLNLSFQTPVKGILVYMPPSFPHLPFNETRQLPIWTATTFW